RRGILVLHPLSENSPADISYTARLASDVQLVSITVAGSPNGDAEVRVLVNQNMVGKAIVGGGSWSVLNVPVREYAGQLATVKIVAAAGGREKWHYETVYIAEVCFFTKAQLARYR